MEVTDPETRGGGRGGKAGEGSTCPAFPSQNEHVLEVTYSMVTVVKVTDLD